MQNKVPSTGQPSNHSEKGCTPPTIGFVPSSFLQSHQAAVAAAALDSVAATVTAVECLQIKPQMAVFAATVTIGRGGRKEEGTDPLEKGGRSRV